MSYTRTQTHTLIKTVTCKRINNMLQVLVGELEQGYHIITYMYYLLSVITLRLSIVYEI